MCFPRTKVIIYNAKQQVAVVVVYSCVAFRRTTSPAISLSSPRAISLFKLSDLKQQCSWGHGWGISSQLKLAKLQIRTPSGDALCMYTLVEAAAPSPLTSMAMKPSLLSWERSSNHSM
jgi:hypothetical protein